ncbi:hypothetical protein HY382_01155 [Candidatus Curtissbacteria bacterium]|nr:hypothetical protein [Candidatus Curtissbacteria bacterium]
MKKLLLLPLTLILILVVFFTLRINQVEISQTVGCVRGDIIDDGLKGRNLLLLDSATTAEKLRKESSCIKDVKIKKIIPGKLIIEIETQKEVAKIENGSLALTENGLITGQTNPNLPTIYSGSLLSASPGQTISDPEILQTLKISGLLTKSDFNAQSIRLVDGDIAFYDANGLIVLFSKSQDPKTQVDSLQQVLAKTKIDASKIAKIDLRFIQPVVLFK